ncbi:T9SS type A sorting domain-containing protein [Adhaeribacter sp. BT258]|uniref:T9SS type A sorting domain-containing protein n=1 Tax=Adhaeribacter terrigena TaxID=2793070 RepID=A0ABS1C654_9BACT|nr:T9SS type A sorting domain-containing protein [Adhaeribacter terrigena]MBK0404837.1 T9SS type A sorting domain-containing protein [Adhaeribacter terrigena]
MKHFRALLFLVIMLANLPLRAQVYVQKRSSDTLTFKDLQRQFGNWKRDKDISKIKGWKYYKRLEMEMLMQTDGQGEPADPAIYINEALRITREKKNLQSARFSNDWYPVGPNALPNNQTGYMENGVGRINCIAFHPTNPATYFVGVAQGGVWKTTNNGVSWTPLTDDLPITRISDIAIDPNNPNTMYISVCDYAYIGAGLFLDGRKRNTHYGLGVYKTTDGGLTWNPTGLSFQQTSRDASLIKKIMVNPANSNNVIACGVSGMYVSTDAGATWTMNRSGLFWDLVQHPTNPNILYAATGWVRTANMGSAAIWKSTDFGLTWAQQPTNIPPTGTVQRIKLAIAPSDPNYVYAIAVNIDNGLHGLYKTTNGGTNWQFINPGLNILEGGNGAAPGGQGNYDLALMVSGTDRNLIYTGGVNIWGSLDGGQTFKPVSHWTTSYGPTVHADIQFMERQASTGNIFVCNDGGLYRTSNLVLGDWNAANSGTPWPTQWTNISNGMAITSFYRISSSKNSAGRIVAGAQDNATFYFDGASWSTIFGGDGMDNYLSPVNNSEIIGSWQYGNFLRSVNGGTSSQNSIFPGQFGEVAEWTAPVVANPNQPGTLYVGFENVYKSVDNGNTWSVASNLPRGINASEICALAIANSNSNVLYAARRVRHEYNLPGSLFKTTNGGANWSNITAGLPDSLYYTSVEVSENNADVAYVSMAGFSAGNKVFRTINGGASWQNISYNLPNLPVNCVKYIPGQNYIMVATDLGVYVLANGSTTWVNQSKGLPNVIVTDIEFNPSLNKIYLSTFGRGIWANDLNSFVSGTKPQIADLKIELFPSPNQGSFTIKFPAGRTAKETYQLEVIDVTGKIIHRAWLSGKTEYQHKLDVPAGLYFAKITGKNVYGVKRFVIE